MDLTNSSVPLMDNLEVVCQVNGLYNVDVFSYGCIGETDFLAFRGLSVKKNYRGARELSGGRDAPLGQAWSRFLLLEDWFVSVKKNSILHQIKLFSCGQT